MCIFCAVVCFRPFSKIWSVGWVSLVGLVGLLFGCVFVCLLGCLFVGLFVCLFVCVCVCSCVCLFDCSIACELFCLSNCLFVIYFVYVDCCLVSIRMCACYNGCLFPSLLGGFARFG